MKIWVVIPAYNEGKNLKDLISQIKRKDVNVLVVDDGSSDDTFKLAENLVDIYIRNKRNFGKGMSLNFAFDHLLRQDNFDFVITMDGDGQHSPLDMDVFLQEAAQGSSFVVGNRMNNPIGMPRLRVITNKLMSLLLSKIVRQNIPDTQCGYRLIKKDVLQQIRIQTNKFEIESELLIKAAQKGFTIKSVPIRSIYFKDMKSRINPFSDTLRFINFLFKLKKK